MEEYFPLPLSRRMRVSGKIRSGSQDYKWRSSHSSAPMAVRFPTTHQLAAFPPVEPDWSVTLQWASRGASPMRAAAMLEDSRAW